jgi:hypothetical protein
MLKRGSSMRAICVATLTTVGALAGSGPASAAGACRDADRAKAGQAYARGMQLSEAKRFEEALAEFEAARRACDSVDTLGAIGSMQLELGRTLDTIATLARYLDEGAGLVPERRSQVESVLRQQMQMANAGLVTVAVSEMTASLRVDGALLPDEAGLRYVALPAGKHRVEASAPGFAPLERKVDVEAGASSRISLVLERARIAVTVPPNDSAAPAATAPAPAQESWLTSGRASGLAIVAAGVSLELAALVHFAWNHQRYTDWKAVNAELAPMRTRPGAPAREAANNALADSIDAAGSVTQALALVGLGVTLAGGGVFVVAGNPGPRSRSDMAMSFRRDF